MRHVPGYENIYAIDENGGVWRVGAPRGRPLAPGLRNGYPSVVLSKDNVKKNHHVHRLMLLAFVGPPPEGEEARHRNGVKTDNRLANLHYGTHKDNCGDRFGHGTQPYGVNTYNAKLTEEQVRDIRAATKGIRRLHLQYGVSRSTVDAIRSRRNWRHLT